jgi:hypothetical protein
MSEGKTMAERVARVEEWIEGHEQRCESMERARGREIRDVKLSIGDVKKTVEGLATGAWTVAGAVILQLCAVAAFLLAKALHLA